MYECEFNRVGSDMPELVGLGQNFWVELSFRPDQYLYQARPIFQEKFQKIGSGFKPKVLDSGPAQFSLG